MKTYSRAFSLIELLAVVGIMAVLLALIAPAAKMIAGGTQLTQSANSLIGVMNQARQTALARGIPVEFRLYESGGFYQAYQLFSMLESGAAVPLTKVQQLPTGVIVDSGTQLSSFMALPNKSWSAQDPQVEVPGIRTNYTCKAFRFRRDGTTSLAPTDVWFLTLHEATSGNGLTAPPKNYATLQLDPVSGQVRTFRP